MKTQDILKEKGNAEQFFKDAFCAEKATMVFCKELSDFNLSGLLKIECTGERGTFHIALLKEKDNEH